MSHVAQACPDLLHRHAHCTHLTGCLLTFLRMKDTAVWVGDILSMFCALHKHKGSETYPMPDNKGTAGTAGPGVAGGESDIKRAAGTWEPLGTAGNRHLLLSDAPAYSTI